MSLLTTLQLNLGIVLYWVVYADGGGTPTGAQIVAGQDSSGVAALAAGSEPYAAAGTYDESTAITTLSAGASYRVAWVATDGTNYSAVEVSGVITTLGSGFNAAWARFSNQILGVAHVS